MLYVPAQLHILCVVVYFIWEFVFCVVLCDHRVVLHVNCSLLYSGLIICLQFGLADSIISNCSYLVLNGLSKSERLMRGHCVCTP